MSDDLPEPACAECDTLRVYVDQARKARDRVQADMVQRYASMTWNQAIEKHAEAKVAHDRLVKAQRKLLTHWDARHSARST